MNKVELIKSEIEKRIKEAEEVVKNMPSSVLFGLIQAYKNVITLIDSFLKEPSKVWHDASEEPVEDKQVLVVFNNRFGYVQFYHRNDKRFYEDGKPKYFLYEITKWAYIDDILNIQEEPISSLDNAKMPVDRWKEACKAACCDRNYRSHYGLTETRDDYFVDGVQWADEHPYKEPVSEDLEQELNNWRHKHFHGRRDKDASGEYLERTSQLDLAQHFAKWQKDKTMKEAIEWLEEIENGTTIINIDAFTNDFRKAVSDDIKDE